MPRNEDQNISDLINQQMFRQWGQPQKLDNVCGTKQAIANEIDRLKLRIRKYEKRLETINDEPIIKDCPHCGTHNYHYQVDIDAWVCACC